MMLTTKRWTCFRLCDGRVCMTVRTHGTSFLSSICSPLWPVGCRSLPCLSFSRLDRGVVGVCEWKGQRWASALFLPLSWSAFIFHLAVLSWRYFSWLSTAAGIHLAVAVKVRCGLTCLYWIIRVEQHCRGNLGFDVTLNPCSSYTVQCVSERGGITRGNKLCARFELPKSTLRAGMLILDGVDLLQDLRMAQTTTSKVLVSDSSLHTRPHARIHPSEHVARRCSCLLRCNLIECRPRDLFLRCDGFSFFIFLSRHP